MWSRLSGLRRRWRFTCNATTHAASAASAASSVTVPNLLVAAAALICVGAPVALPVDGAVSVVRPELRATTVADMGVSSGTPATAAPVHAVPGGSPAADCRGSGDTSASADPSRAASVVASFSTSVCAVLGPSQISLASDRLERTIPARPDSTGPRITDDL
ncbi:unnamed protein product [Closterium sp. NIES-65]|nr:unnamed protein product [Closterium sp. NIES-65]